MLIDTGDMRLNYAEWGSGDTVVFIHGNLACGMWFDLVGPLVADHFRVIAVDWRGCGASDKPVPFSDDANYTIRQHALDMLAAIRCLGIDQCHLATHSTGGLISTYMVLMEPERFGKVLALNPVGPMGLRFPPESFALLEAMKVSREKTRDSGPGGVDAVPSGNPDGIAADVRRPRHACSEAVVRTARGSDVAGFRRHLVRNGGRSRPALANRRPPHQPGVH
jgi:pimeloyl-ACP methyl ester carboxylesterase